MCIIMLFWIHSLYIYYCIIAFNYLMGRCNIIVYRQDVNKGQSLNLVFIELKFKNVNYKWFEKNRLVKIFTALDRNPAHS